MWIFVLLQDGSDGVYEHRESTIERRCCYLTSTRHCHLTSPHRCYMTSSRRLRRHLVTWGCSPSASCTSRYYRVLDCYVQEQFRHITRHACRVGTVVNRNMTSDQYDNVILSTVRVKRNTMSLHAFVSNGGTCVF